MKISKATVLLSIVLVVGIIFGLSLTREKKDPDVKPVEKTKHSVSETTSEPETQKKRDINPDDKLIALTFDDGPYSPVTERILDILEKNDSVATFFIVGSRLEGEEAYQASLKRAFDTGCEIASHTYTHTYLTKMTPEKRAEEIQKTSDFVKKITGKGVDLLRPPGGFCVEDVAAPLILWSVDSQDWKHRNSDAVYNEVVNYVFDGCIVLMHDLYPTTADAVERFVPELISQGYKFVTVSELAEARGYNLENGKSVHSIKPEIKEEETTSEEYTTVLDNIVE